MPMSQSELDEFSDTFQEAFDEMFGAEVFYLRLGAVTPDNALYDERIGKLSSYTTIGPIRATFKQNPTVEEIVSAGLRGKISGIVTFVTKALRDRTILEVKTTDRIRITDRNGVTTTYQIRMANRRVQFGDNYIFTKVGVDDLDS